MNIKDYNVNYLYIALLFCISIHQQSVASIAEDLPYESLYQQFKNSPLVPHELREVLPNKIIGDASRYSSEISVKDGYRWVSVKFRILFSMKVKEMSALEKEMKEKYPYLWTGYASEAIVSDRTRVVFYGGGTIVEYYSSYRIGSVDKQ